MNRETLNNPHIKWKASGIPSVNWCAPKTRSINWEALGDPSIKWEALETQGINRNTVANPCMNWQVRQNPSINPEALETQVANWKATRYLRIKWEERSNNPKGQQKGWSCIEQNKYHYTIHVLVSNNPRRALPRIMRIPDEYNANLMIWLEIPGQTQ